MSSRRFALLLLALAAFEAAACSPEPFYQASSPQDLAAKLHAQAAAIVYARVIEAEADASNPVHVVGRARIHVLERFKGPASLNEIYTSILVGTCSNPRFSAGEQRVFALYEKRQPEGTVRYFEIHAWLGPNITQQAILQELRHARPK